MGKMGKHMDTTWNKPGNTYSEEGDLIPLLKIFDLTKQLMLSSRDFWLQIFDQDEPSPEEVL